MKPEIAPILDELPDSGLARLLQRFANDGAPLIDFVAVAREVVGILQETRVEDVCDTQDNKVGAVNGILLDKDGRVSTVIIGVGGFLGVGEKHVAVPFSALKVAEKAGDRYLVTDATKEALEKAPGYIYDETKGVWVPATKQG